MLQAFRIIINEIHNITTAWGYRDFLLFFIILIQTVERTTVFIILWYRMFLPYLYSLPYRHVKILGHSGNLIFITRHTPQKQWKTVTRCFHIDIHKKLHLPYSLHIIYIRLSTKCRPLCNILHYIHISLYCIKLLLSKSNTTNSKSRD